MSTAAHDSARIGLDVFRHLWGMGPPGTPFLAWQDALPEVKRAPVAYAGVEFPVLMVKDPDELREALDTHDLEYIPMVFTFGDTVKEHLAALRQQLDTARQVPHRLVVCHGGRDSFSESDAVAFFEGALALERDLDLVIAHETHRSRILYNPFATVRLLQRFETLKLNCDYSHWVVVCERLLDDQPAILEACAERALHVHARVGFENGPQVSDPRAPEWQTHLDAHERWWDLIWTAQKQRGVTRSTLTPEFGPPSYQPVAPHTQAPLADLATVCDWMAQRELDRFAARFDRPRKAERRADSVE